MIVSVDSLISALERVKPGVNEKGLLDNFRFFVFDTSGISTYNDEIGVFYPLKGIDVIGGVDSSSFFALVKKLSSKEVELKVEGEELRVISGRSKAGIRLVTDVERCGYKFEDVESLDWINCSDEFVKALVFASFSCSKDLALPVLTCVSVNGNVVDSSDNFRITRVRVSDFGFDGNFLIPFKAIRELAKYEGLEAIAVDGGWVFFRFSDGTIFYCRVFDIEFPDVSEHLEVDGPVLEFPANMIDAVERSRVFSKEGGLDLVDENINVKVEKKGIVVESRSDLGWYEENVDWEGKVKSSISFSIHPQFFIDVLKRSSSCTIGERKVKFSGDNWEHVVALMG